MTSTVLAVALLSSLSPAPAEARSGRAGLDRTERAVVKLVNAYRARHGRPRVRVSRRLSRVADRHSLEMVQHGFFAHSSRNGTGAGARVRRSSGARSVGENIAFVSSGGGRPAHRVVGMWINSAGHRAVLLNPSFRRIGVARRPGSVGGTAGSAYTADFASRR
ncbi:MAG: CAP domain-containing protein [Solirubrobacterales bacterium]|nr:CAP domain-containing protein [Solirubrobacterales bacterium]